MDELSAKEEAKEEVIQLYNLIKNKSSELNRARPQSVACGLIFYWLSNIRKNTVITLSEFAKIVALSELTINKISKEIEIIFERQKILNFLTEHELTQEQKRNLFEVFSIVKKSHLFKTQEQKDESVRYIVYFWLYKNGFIKDVSKEPIYTDIEKYVSKKKVL